MFCSTKDIISTLEKSNIIYCLICPGCNENYIRKTDCNPAIHLLYVHGSCIDQLMHQHHLKCDYFMDIMNLSDIDSTSTSVVKKIKPVKSQFIYFSHC